MVLHIQTFGMNIKYYMHFKKNKFEKVFHMYLKLYFILFLYQLNYER